MSVELISCTPFKIASATPSVSFAATQANDLIVVVNATTMGGMSLPSGYTFLGGGSFTSATDGKLSCVYKVATGGETSVSWSGDTNHIGAAFILRGADPINPIDAYSAPAYTGNAIAFPSLVTTRPGDFIINAANSRLGEGTGAISGWANASLTSLTERQDANDDGGTGLWGCVASGQQISAGTVAATTATGVNLSAGNGLAVAIKAAFTGNNLFFGSL